MGSNKVEGVGGGGGGWGGGSGREVREEEENINDRVIHDIMNDVFLPQGRYPENFVLTSLLEVCPEGGGQELGYLEDVEGS